MQYICIKTGDEGSIYAARQGMRASNHITNMLDTIVKERYVTIVACPDRYPLSCCIYTALVSLLFGTIIPTFFNEMLLLPCFTGFSLYTVNSLLTDTL